MSCSFVASAILLSEVINDGVNKGKLGKELASGHAQLGRTEYSGLQIGPGGVR